MDTAALDTLTGWDWFVLLVVIGSLAVGLWRGLIRTIFGLAAWVVALIGTPLVAPALILWSGLQAHPWVVLVAVFVALLLIVRLAGWALSRLVGRLGLGVADRLLGAVFGVARGLLLVLLAASAAHAMELDRRTAWTKALSRPLLDALVEFARPYLPERGLGIRET